MDEGDLFIYALGFFVVIAVVLFVYNSPIGHRKKMKEEDERLLESLAHPKTPALLSPSGLPVSAGLKREEPGPTLVIIVH